MSGEPLSECVVCDRCPHPHLLNEDGARCVNPRPASPPPVATASAHECAGGICCVVGADPALVAETERLDHLAAEVAALRAERDAASAIVREVRNSLTWEWYARLCKALGVTDAGPK